MACVRGRVTKNPERSRTVLYSCDRQIGIHSGSPWTRTMHSLRVARVVGGRGGGFMHELGTNRLGTNNC